MTSMYRMHSCDLETPQPQRISYDSMSPSTTTNPAGSLSSLCPVASNMPRRVSFGATPSLERLQTSRTSQKASESHCMLFGDATIDSMTNSKAGKAKPISAQDKECEAKMAKLYKVKSKKGIGGLVNWLHTKVDGGDIKKM